ncbi:sensor domain-containing diguanylate cyclase [uncultured Salinicola sp.]|uniref:sensor domain-containing diguanylate cyclase n=1 Tax=uncultured Salinicola sp. TaxID=1193542 RepID=UPI00260D119A|nr:sensor domain-containing diguanylate cyclase [uncultured Salinicola sp.]
MSRLLLLLHTRLALRTTAIILLIVTLLGVLFLALAVYLRAESVQREQQSRVQELLTTVERTAQIGCFLGDRQLAQEVTDGLLSNNIVSAVRIDSSDGTILASGRADPEGEPAASVVRDVSSPFEPGTSVCRITVAPDQAYIDKLVAQASNFIGGALLLQLIGIGFCVVLVVVKFVTRPITGLSHRLSELEAETGQQLQAPRGNKDDEIGQLVISVNAMIDNLVQSLGEERRLRLEREVEERRYRAIFDNVEAGIFELDSAGFVRSANPAFLRLFDMASGTDLERHPVAFASLVGDGEGEMHAFAVDDEAGGYERQWEVALDSGERQRWISLILSPLETGRLQGVAHDVTERRKAADAAERMAMTDALTGLGNRRGFDHRLAVMARHHRLYPERCHALITLDFDHFKQINDTYGHPVGDRALCHVGDILAGLMRQRDYVARLGGDEFVVLLEGCNQRSDVEVVLERFLHRLRKPLEVESGIEIVIGVSIGIAMVGLDTDDAEQAVRFSDIAMYAAKRAGRNTWRFYEPVTQS